MPFAPRNRLAPRYRLALAAALAIGLATPLGGCAPREAMGQLQDWWQAETLARLAQEKAIIAERRVQLEELDTRLATLRRVEAELAALKAQIATMRAAQATTAKADPKLDALEAKRATMATQVDRLGRDLPRARKHAVLAHNEALARARDMSADVRPAWRVDGEPIK